MPRDPKENKKILDNEFERLKMKQSDLQAKKAVIKDEMGKKQGETIRKMFDIMLEAGVDMNNIDSIRAFLDKLYQRNPDLLEMFERAFNQIAGEPIMPDQQSAPPMPGAMPGQPMTPPMGMQSGAPGGEQNLMDKFNNLSGQVMRGQ